jgi:hypothetical protein
MQRQQKTSLRGMREFGNGRSFPSCLSDVSRLRSQLLPPRPDGLGSKMVEAGSRIVRIPASVHM